MKTYLIIFICVLPLNSEAAKPLYVSIDQYGNKQFSDIPPDNRIFTIKEQSSINTVKWHSSPQIKLTPDTQSHKKQDSKQQPSRAEICINESLQIKQLENKLKQALKAQLFDELKKKLRSLRWSHQKKSC